jgi:hypothetical protein
MFRMAALRAVLLADVVRGRRARFAWAPLAGLLGVLALVVSIPAAVVFGTWAQMRAIEADWTIAGPPCPQAAEPSPAVVGPKPPHAITFGGAQFERWYGAVNCQQLAGRGEDYPVCQFNAPGAVRVTSGGRTTVFQVGVAQVATVTVRHGRASCVAAGWFRY